MGVAGGISRSDTQFGSGMDGISSIGATAYFPSSAQINTVSPPVTVPQVDTVTLSGDDPSSSGAANVYSPDAGFTALMQTDPGLAQDYAADAQFGYSNDVLASDDTLTSTDQSATTQSTTTDDSATLAAKVDLSTLNFNGSVASALFGATDASSVFFTGASMSNLLTSQGSAALAYLTPQAAAQSGSVNLSA
jgi:hypothetical protein